jgi:hypothetical protein
MLRKAAAQGRIQWDQHALECFLERGISRADVGGAIMNGQVAEIYAAQRPYPSCLMLYVRTGSVHMALAADRDLTPNPWSPRKNSLSVLCRERRHEDAAAGGAMA